MTISMAQANATLGNISTFDELRNLIAQLDTTGTGSQTFLYSGNLGNEMSANDIAKAFADNNSDIRIVDKTEAAKFLDFRTNDPLRILLTRLGGDPAQSGYDSNGNKIGTPSESNKFLFGVKDANGKLGAWATVSKNFVALAEGDVRVIAPQADLTRVFGEVEVPELLKNTKITSVEGIPIFEAQAMANAGKLELLKNNIKLHSFDHLAKSGLYITNNGTTLAKFLSLAGQSLANDGYTPDQLEELNKTLKSVDPQYKAYLNGVAENTKSFAAAAKSAGVAGVKFLGAAAVVFTFAIASSEASAEEANGNHDAARHRMNLWAVETAGSQIGAMAGAALAAMALAFFAVTSAPVLIVAGIGAAIGGGFLGGKGAASFYEYLSKMSPELQADIIDRLNILFYGDYNNASPELKISINNGVLSFKDVNFINISRDEVVAKAKESIAWRYALRELNPFVVEDANYDKHNIDGTLDIYDPKTDKGFMSDAWILERASFLEFYKQYLMSGNTSGVLSIDGLPLPIPGDIHFADFLSSKPVDLVVDGVDLFVIPRKEIIFGGSKNESFVCGGANDWLFGGDGNDTLKGEAGFDYLEGNAGDDLIYGGDDADELVGGDGDDQLVGEGGSDILEGGKGNDTYSFTGQFGRDMIKDSDGIGSIEFSSVKLTQLTQSTKDSIIYYDDVNNPTKKAVVIDEGNTKSLIISTVTKSGDKIIDSGNSVTIKDWTGNNLGITLKQADAITPDVNVFVANDSTHKNSLTFANAFDIDSNAGQSNYTAIKATGTSTNDLLMGLNLGNDTLLGGDGNDVISSGYTGVSDFQSIYAHATDKLSADSIEGGKGDDYIVAAPGAIAHGGDDNDVLNAGSVLFLKASDAVWQDLQQIIDIKPTVKITSTGKTEITQGLQFNKNLTSSYTEFPSVIPGRKLIARVLNETTSVAYVDSNTLVDNNKIYDNIGVWQFKQFEIVPESPRTYQDFAALPGANLFGDKGNDYLFGGLKADYLSGGEGADTIVGGEGNDVIDGGTENDFIAGSEGNDLIIGAAGNDEIYGGASNARSGAADNDTIYGGSGNDKLYGNGGADYLDGGTGLDILDGGEGNDYLYGGDDEEKDMIYGGTGDDTVVMGLHDQADLGGGKNIYIWNTHQVTTTNVNPQASPSPAALSVTPTSSNFFADISGNSFGDTVGVSSPAVLTEINYIKNSEGNNTLGISGLSSLKDANIDISGNYLLITTADNQQLAIQDGVSNTPVQIAFGSSVQQLVDTPVVFTPLTDDHFLNGIAPLDQAQITSADLIIAKLKTSVVTTGAANQYLAGGLNNDTLTANIAGSTLIGGEGNDNLLGDISDDTYLIRKDDGNDTITEKGGLNHIKFDKNIAASDVVVRRVGADLVFTISEDQQVTVKNMFNAQTGALQIANSIKDVSFYGELSSTVWNLDQIKQNATKSTVGDDSISGFDGDDTFYYSLGNGQDFISDSKGNDTIELVGINQTQVLVRKDVNNNLILTFTDGGSITVKNAFDAQGNFTENAIETIKFSDSSTWNLTQLKSEVLKDQVRALTGTDANDVVVGDAGKDLIVGLKGNDQLLGGDANDIYEYALGDGNDVITDTNGVDAIKFSSGILPGDVIARSNGKDLTLTLSDGGVLTVKDMFVTKTPNVVDPLITTLLTKLETRWISQAEALIENHFGLVGSGDLQLNFGRNIAGGHVANISFNVSSNGQFLIPVLTLDLDDFAEVPNGSAPFYYDRFIAHEMTHAVMASNMNVATLPGWFLEGTAEFIQGADERVKNELNLIDTQTNFEALFKTTVGSPSTSAGYAVGYIAVKFLDNDIRANGGTGIREIFDQLKTGKTLDESLAVVSLAHGGMGGLWDNLLSFETHFKATGLASFDSLLDLNNADTGSIAGSDYGNAPLDAKSVVPDVNSGSPKYFNLVIPPEYIAVGDEHNEIESIQFVGGDIWDLTRINAEVLKNAGKSVNGTTLDDDLAGGVGDDTITGGKGNDTLNGRLGDDHYVYAKGDGIDYIVDEGGSDILELGVGILPSDVLISHYRSTSGYKIYVDGYNYIANTGVDKFTGKLTSSSIEALKFSDGTVWDKARLEKELVSGGNSDDTIYGFLGGDVISAKYGDDVIYASGGNDTLIGGLGDDTLIGDTGDDVYLYALGDGNDTISDSAIGEGYTYRDTTGKDILRFSAGIDPTSVTVKSDDLGNLLLTMPDTTVITIVSKIDSTGVYTPQAVETIEFSNGIVWDAAYINSVLKLQGIVGTSGNDTLVGTAGPDSIIGGAGNDYLLGDTGNDVYKYNLGDGSDTIADAEGTDSIELGVSIRQENLSADHQGTNLILKFADSSTMTLQNQFDAFGSPLSGAIENITFKYDGVKYSFNTIKSIALRGSDRNEVVNAFNSADRVYGGAGNDTLYGLDGADTLGGGVGNDILYGGAGDDTYNFGQGDANDTIIDSAGVDTVNLQNFLVTSYVPHIDPITKNVILNFSSGESLTLSGMLNDDLTVNQSSAIEWLEFAYDGNWHTLSFDEIVYEVWNRTSHLFNGTAAPDRIEGADAGDTLIGGQGNDYLDGKNGNDIYVYNLGDGDDTVGDTSGLNDLKLGPNFLPTDVAVARDIDKLIVDLSAGGSIIFANINAVGSIQFSNGDAWDNAKILQLISSNNSTPKNLTGTSFNDTLKGDVGSDSIVGLAGNDTLFGSVGNDTLLGGDGNDVIYGGTGSDSIDGGIGDDYISGGAGDSTLIGGEGNDTLEGWGYNSNGGLGDDLYRIDYSEVRHNIIDAGGADSIELGAGWTPEKTLIRRTTNGSGYTDLTILGTPNYSYPAIVIKNVFDASGVVKTANAIEQIKFSDGTFWDFAKMLDQSVKGTDRGDYLYGSSLNDNFVGGLDNDYLSGAGGDDTYSYSVGDGVDTINEFSGNDVIAFGNGITATDVTVSKSENSLIFYVNNSGRIYLDSVFTNTGALVSARTIEKVTFFDSVEWDLNTILRNAGYEVTPPSQPTAVFDAAGKVITGVAGAGGTIEVKNSTNTVILGTAIANATTGAYSITLATALINREMVNVTAKDAAGNVSAVNAIIAPDKTAPLLPTAAFDTAGKVITGVAEAGSTVVVKNSGNTTTLGTATADATTGAYSITLTIALINKETVNVTAKDAAGNISVAKSIIAPDKTAPSQPTAAFDTTGKVITGVAEAGSTVEVKNSGNTATLGTTTANATTGAYTITLTTALINKETVNVTAKDAAGNISVAKSIIAPDKTAPSQPTAAFDTTGKVITGVAEAGSVVEVKNSGNTATLGTATANATTGAYTITLTTALINKETVNVTAKDAAGNVSVAKSIIAPDKTAPSQPTAAFDTTGKVITGVAEAGSTVEVKNSGNTATLGTATANATTGAYTITLTTALINKETINVTAKDAAGNISVAKSIIAPDKTAPSQPTAAFDTTGKVITGVAEAGSVVEVKNSGNTATLGTATANATTGAYTITLTAALINKETVNVTAKDIAGNISIAKGITAPDLTPPAQPTASIDTTGKIISGVAEAGSTVIVKNALATQLGTATANASTGAYTITLTTALLNNEVLNVMAKDVAGNTSVAKIINAPDKTAPAQPTAAFDSTGKIITGVAEAGSTVIVKNAAATQIGTAVANASTGAYSITLATALINKEVVSVTAKDTAGNISVAKSIIAPDKTAPSQPTAAFDTTGKVITGIAEVGSTVEVKNSGNTATLGTATANATTGAYTITLTTALINKETVNVTAKDAAGNISPVKSIIAPLIASPLKAAVLQKQSVVEQPSTINQLDSMIQAMAAFSPPVASESRIFVGMYDATQPLLVSQS